MTTKDEQPEKYQLLLNLANIVFKHLNKDPIDNLLDFKMIERIHIVKKEVNDDFRLIMEDFYTHFDKHKTCFYKKDLPSWTFLTLKKASSQLGLKIEITHKDVSIRVNNKAVRYKGSFYTIVNK